MDKQKLDTFYKLTEYLFLELRPELVFPNIHLTLDRILSENKTINILSNTAFIKGETVRKVLKFYNINDSFLFQLYSDEEGVSKPNAVFFDCLYKSVNAHRKIDKKDIVHIGDNRYSDFEGAISFGFNAILI